MRYHERMIMLSVLDTQWKDHLLNMDHLKEGIGLRGYGQHDPLVEYKRESFDMFEGMMRRFQEETARYLFHMQIVDTAPTPVAAGLGRQWRTTSTRAQEAGVYIHRRSGSTIPAPKKTRIAGSSGMAGSNGNATAPLQVVRGQAKVGRNDPCPCGSGKKYKKCHGVEA